MSETTVSQSAAGEHAPRDGTPKLLDRVLAEVMWDSHRYVPGIEPSRPTLIDRSYARRLRIFVREHCRDLVERVAGRLGFTRRHLDPDVASRALAEVVELSDQLEATYARLGDEPSRRHMVDVLKLRVLGPYHAPLRITPSTYRAKQAYADRELRLEPATLDVSDAWFSPLSRYRVPVA